jgi:hypothetical protein
LEPRLELELNWTTMNLRKEVVIAGIRRDCHFVDRVKRTLFVMLELLVFNRNGWAEDGLGVACC